MMIVKKSSSVSGDSGERSQSFNLLPKDKSKPTIAKHPSDTISPIDRERFPSGFDFKGDRITLLEGVGFTIGVELEHPSDQLEYRWYRGEESLYSINAQRDGKGVDSFTVQGEQATKQLSGDYYCDILNENGSTRSRKLSILIITAGDYTQYVNRNLVKGGSGESSLTDWEDSAGLRVLPFVDDITVTKNNASFGLADFPVIGSQQKPATELSHPFYFGRGASLGLESTLQSRFSADPDLYDPMKISDPTEAMSEYNQWIMHTYPPQIVANEDGSDQRFSSFFPSPQHIDRYNLNDQVGLFGQLDGGFPTYITREPIQLAKHGGRGRVEMKQLIPVDGISDLIDGQVQGLDAMYAHVFAYVGIGISDYKIKVTTTEGPRIFNYFIADSEHIYDRLVDETNPHFPEVHQSGLGARKYTLVPGSAIELIPKCYDRVNITLDFVSAAGAVIKSITVPTPRELDIWALKENSFFCSTLYSVYEWLIPSGNDIVVMGQKLTDTDAITRLFQPEAFTDPAEGLSIQDGSVRFSITKYNHKRWSSTIPPNRWYFTNQEGVDRALIDRGAAAMIAVGGDYVIPRGTSAINFRVSFIHSSNMINDPHPEFKGWTSQEIYQDVYGQSTGQSARLIPYGNPRCGITSIKLLITDGNLSEVNSYKIPPPSNTVLGLRKKLLAQRGALDASKSINFKYRTVNPKPTQQIQLEGNISIATSNSQQVSMDLDQLYDVEELNHAVD